MSQPMEVVEEDMEVSANHWDGRGAESWLLQRMKFVEPVTGDEVTDV